MLACLFEFRRVNSEQADGGAAVTPSALALTIDGKSVSVNHANRAGGIGERPERRHDNQQGASGGDRYSPLAPDEHLKDVTPRR